MMQAVSAAAASNAFLRFIEASSRLLIVRLKPGQEVVGGGGEIEARPPAQVLCEPAVGKARARRGRERPHGPLGFVRRFAPAKARETLREKLAPFGQRPRRAGAEVVEPVARCARIQERD